jgi:selenocysteine lyase/cysteine desulfurase
MALTGSAAMWPDLGSGGRLNLTRAPLPPAPLVPTEAYWSDIRARFLVPPDLGFINAANLCPTSIPVVETLEKNTRALDANPSSATRTVLQAGREESRRLIAGMVHATPEEIVLTRNTTEANNFVSSGLKLGAGDEVVLFGDNHPSNLDAWRVKAKRFGFTLVEVPAMLPHPGTDFYVDAFAKAITPRTKVMSITHVTNTIGDMLPVTELCGMARSRGVLSHVDGAQSFGIIELDMTQIRPDFYSGSAHKWICGPKEIGILFIAAAAQDRISPSVVGLYPGSVGISKTMEGFGQRDEAALATLGAAVRFQEEIGRPAIEKRSRELAQRLVTDLRKIDGVTLYTNPDPTRMAAILVFKPANLDPRKLVSTLYEKDRIVVATSGRPGIRMSPHIYNTMDEIDRAVAAIKKYIVGGLPA